MRNQRGFVVGRQLLENVVELDAAARRVGRLEFRDRLPIFMAFDLIAVFPSVSHRWMIAAIRVQFHFWNILLCMGGGSAKRRPVPSASRRAAP